MTAFVTGGSGFVGGAVIRALIAQGEPVRALARSPVAKSTVIDLGAEPVAGDLIDRSALADAMNGCDVVFHVAGVNRMCPRDPTELDAINIAGAVTAVHAAADARIARLVLTSSSAAIGERPGTLGTEDSVHRGRFLSRYERSKYLGERQARAAGRERGIEVVTVNPSSVQGPGRTTGSAKLLLYAARARTAALLDTSFSIVDVDDCAIGHLLAARNGVADRRYLLSGATLTMRSAASLLRRQIGRPQRVVWIPRSLVRAVTPLTGFVTRFREDPAVCPATIRSLLHGHRYDGSRATRELGLVYRSLEETLERVLTWYRTHGMLPKAHGVGFRSVERPAGPVDGRNRG
ncbi:MAG: NAD-dependent epimerase/dehydratase family protein [Actinobacteria bacterium]|nr:MAG: NAD-dependent epimerase/dehydratase family protein [Actinomycetota bacterium]TMK91747.1 MAG: NAD-dependent epimerase/dehydratase family protein [Actinomycetota bacterium]TMM26245.1 MAG: NAD-dependent epimerase/dehydratase family protein [Actinomycetota bacterium]